MRKVVLSMVVSLDGYIEGPNKEFIAPPWSADMDRWTSELRDAGDTLVFGRITWEGLAEYWPQAEREPSTPAEWQLARYMNGVPKFVFSRRLESADAWASSTIIREDPTAAIAELRAQPGKDIVLLGGAGLAAAFMIRELIDEYRLLVTPQLFGGGTRLFADGRARADLKLIEHRAMDTGAVLLRYER